MQENLIQTPETLLLSTHFSNFSDDVRLGAGYGHCCRFAIATGVHQGAQICLAKYIWDQRKSFELGQKNEVSMTKKTDVEVLPGIC